MRQLESHFGEAQARGADTVLVTVRCSRTPSGSLLPALGGSGWTFMSSLRSAWPTVGEVYHTSGNVLLDRVLGATLHSFPVG